jgi:hypothetical protein
MQLKELKEILDSMSVEQLNKELIVIDCSEAIVGYAEAEFATEDLYYIGDDPSELYVLSELQDQYEQEEIDDMEIIVNKGDLIFELS